MSPLKVLITNNTLAEYAGSELYARDVALSLLRRGHRPLAYSQIHGRVAQELTAAGVPVYDDLSALATPPDIIHGQHNLETLTALLQFPHTPAIFICHGYVPWQEHPPAFPRILRYLAVDLACQDRLRENGIPPDRAEVLLNFVDLERFQPRAALPARPRKALVYSNYANESNYLPILRAACQHLGIELDAAGGNCGRRCHSPETLLPQYDLVFAKARSAIEALAVGCAVITCDTSGFGALVTTRNLEVLRQLNFGFRTLTRPMDQAVILKEIGDYDPADARATSLHIRAVADMERAIDRLLHVYRETLVQFRQMTPSPEAEEKAVAAYLSWLSIQVKDIVNHNASARRQGVLAAGAPPRAALKTLLRSCFSRFRG
jgi:glycosyltransferase involved in cell wall biosynthesis